MVAKTDLWDRLGKTDPSHTKPFKRAGGFSGTSIKPIWSYRRMTEEFGSCGEGWGVNQPSFQVVSGADGEVLVYCTASIWYENREKIVFGVGGDKVVVKQSSGLRGDDEAFKKAFTDGITNALKMIGVGADVHMGMFDDDKYVNSMKEEFAPIDEVHEGRLKFISACSEQIKAATDAATLREWWGSEAQKRQRRDFELSKSEVDGLLAEVVAKLKSLEPKQAAA